LLDLPAVFLRKAWFMRRLFGLIAALFIATTLALTAVAGPEPLPSGKEMKEVAPAPPPPCNWTGFYLGVNVGGQFGHSEDLDHNYNVDFDGIPPDKPWGYSESGVVAGGQVGYNWQWNWLVLGPEFDVGYMNLDGRGTEPGSPGGDTRGESDGDVFTTLRGRLGVAFNQWLFYGTGGGIGVNYTTRVIDDCITSPCGSGLVDARKTDFNWGYTVGGGIERRLGCHWSIKVEYLFFKLDDQDFSGEIFSSVGGGGGTSVRNRPAVGVGAATIFDTGVTASFHGETAGHIVRAGLNYKF
jgi:outer membrane immunogenic protein